MRRYNFDRVLFVGTGGGNDVFSATLAMACLWRFGWRWHRCSLAGVLSPFHAHSTLPTDIVGLTRVLPGSERFLIRYGDERQIGFIDARVAEMVADTTPHGCTDVYGLSVSAGSRGLAETFRTLAKEYELIVLVDLGGDIFFPGRDARVLSPMLDAMVLRAFVDSGANGLLFEAGPGTDGELTPETLRLALGPADSYPLDLDIVDWWEKLYRTWIGPVRPGRTVPKTIEAYRSREPELVVPYRARHHLGRRKWFAQFDQRIDTELCRHFYSVDPARIANPFAVDCDGPLDWFRKTQAAQFRTNCEANLEYLPRKVGGLWQFLTPSPRFPEAVRDEIIEAAFQEHVTLRRCDFLLMWPDDWMKFEPRWSGRLRSWDAGGGLTAVARKEMVLDINV